MGPDDVPCGRRTTGLLQRRPVVLDDLVHIGKETNRMEEVEQGLVHDWKEIRLMFREPKVTHLPELSKCIACVGPVRSPRMSYCSSACRQRAYRQRSKQYSQGGEAN